MTDGPVPLSIDELPLLFSEEHRALAVWLKALAPRLVAAEGHGLDAARALSEVMASGGLYRLLVPEPGAAIDMRGLCLVRELLGYVAPLADAIFAVQGLGSYPVVLAGSAPQRARLLPRVVAGVAIGGFALTEPEAGSDVGSLRTTARKDGDDFVLDGDKTFISNVGIATHYVVFANADPTQGKRGITAFLVEEGTAGMSSTPIAMSIDHPIGALKFEGCRVPASAVIGEVGGGFRLAMQTLDAFRVTVGAAAAGMARRALDETRAHVRARRQFGKALAEQQMVQSYVADMATSLQASHLLVLYAALARDSGAADITREAAMAKMFATEAAQSIIDKAVQLHGGLGVVAGSVVERLYREIRPLRIYEGTTEIQRLIIAREVLGK